MRELCRFATGGFHPMSCKLSPYVPGTIVAGLSQNYALSGGGQVMLVDGSRHSRYVQLEDACFDVCFSATGPHAIYAACGNGFIYLLAEEEDGASLRIAGRSAAGHAKECASIDCGTDHVVSGGWDGSVLLFNAQLRLRAKMAKVHAGAVHQVAIHPLLPKIAASSGSDGRISVIDHTSRSIVRLIKNMTGHPDVLSVDWCKYDPNVLAAGSADGAVRVYDVRGAGDSPLATIRGHRRAVRRLQYSPFSAHQLTSVSYDMSVIRWNTDTATAVDRCCDFGEFLTGIDHSCFDRSQFITCSWDRSIRVFVG